MSYPHMFGTPEMGTIADKVDNLRRVLQTVQKPSKDGTGSATAVAQAGFHSKHFAELCQQGKESWHDFLRAQTGELYAVKDPAELQERLIGVMAICADWYTDIERRQNGG